MSIADTHTGKWTVTHSLEHFLTASRCSVGTSPPSLPPSHLLTLNKTQPLRANTQADARDHKPFSDMKHVTLLASSSRWGAFYHLDTVGALFQHDETFTDRAAAIVGTLQYRSRERVEKFNDMREDEYFLFPLRLHHWWIWTCIFAVEALINQSEREERSPHSLWVNLLGRAFCCLTSKLWQNPNVFWLLFMFCWTSIYSSMQLTWMKVGHIRRETAGLVILQLWLRGFF